MIQSIRIISPPNYPHSQAFAEIAEAFAEALSVPISINPKSGSLVFGAHSEISSLFPNDIIFQSEQIAPDCPWISEDYLQALRSHQVWDYSAVNIAELAKRDISAKLVPISYMPSMTRFESGECDIDVLFYGSTNPRRITILNDLIRAGLRVHKAFNVYGKERDELIARSKVILNTHFYENGIFEIFRCSHLFANSKCVVAERGRDTDLDGRHRRSAVFREPSRIVETCVMLAKRDEWRKEQEFMAFDDFRATTLAESLKEVSS